MLLLAAPRTPSDAEFTYFTAAVAGTATIKVLVLSGSRTNLNLRVTVFDANGQPVASQSGLGVPQFSVSVAPGVYYVSITGIGVAADATTQGYTTYGSRGVYEMVVIWPSDGNLPPAPNGPPPPVSSGNPNPKNP